MAKRSRIAIELEEHEKRLSAPDPAETYGARDKKPRRPGRVKRFFKDQLIRRTSTKR